MSFVSQQEYNSCDFRSPLGIPLLLSGNFAELRSNHFHTGVDVKTNLAIVGAGLVGKRHADAISQIDHTNLSAIVDTSVDGRDCAISHNVPWYETLSDLLSAENPDGVILATPTPLHVEQGLECITNRVPVMIEKPLANSAFEAKELVFLSEELGVPVIVGHHRRHNPLIQEAREIINNGNNLLFIFFFKETH